MALVAVVTVTMVRSPRLWPVLAVMLASWAATRLVSAHDMAGLWQAAADITCGAALLAIRRPAILVLPVAALFLIMVSAYAAHDAGLLSRDAMWAWADVSGYLQLLIILGAAFSNGRRARLGMGIRDRARRHHHATLVPSRLPRAAISRDLVGGD